MSSQTRPHGSATVCVYYAMSLASCDANDFACYCLEFLRQVITLQYCECCVRVLSSALLVKCVAIIVLRGVRIARRAHSMCCMCQHNCHCRPASAHTAYVLSKRTHASHNITISPVRHRVNSDSVSRSMRTMWNRWLKRNCCCCRCSVWFWST